MPDKSQRPGRQPGFRQLNGGKLHETIASQAAEIAERFPDSGLSRVAQELDQLCVLSRERIRWIAQPIWFLRLPRYFILVIFTALFAYLAWRVFFAPGSSPLSPSDWVQAAEAEVNLLIFAGAAVVFVWTLERRIKRARALAALHELRSIAHVIDMHQIAKDPDWMAGDGIEEIGGGSARTVPDLLRYLDYCSDLLALTGKVAALHLREMDDPAVVGAVQEIEDLTTGLARKIWQKLTLLTKMNG